MESTTGHGPIMRHFAKSPIRKTMFFMFGNTDIDFTYYRTLCIRKSLDDSTFFNDRIDAYNSFLTTLLSDDANHQRLHALCVLAPQPTPLNNETFFPVTAGIIKLPEAALRQAGQSVDLSHPARIRRVLDFNDLLEAKLIKDSRVHFYRADRRMLDSQGRLLERFYPRDVHDHHAEKRHTARLWKSALRAQFRSFVAPGRLHAENSSSAGGDQTASLA